MALITHPVLSFPHGRLSILATALAWIGYAFALAAAFTCELWARIVRAELEIPSANVKISLDRSAYLGLWYYKGDWENSNLEVDNEDTSCHPYENSFSSVDHTKASQIFNIISLCTAFLACSYLLLIGCRIMSKMHRQAIAITLLFALTTQGLGFVVLEGSACANETLLDLNPNINVTYFHAYCIIGKGGAFAITSMVLWLFSFLAILAIKDTEDASDQGSKVEVEKSDDLVVPAVVGME